MGTRVFLIHGWSVKETTTYQALHLKLAEQGYDLHEIFLGRYVSLDDHVEVKDIAAAMHKALIEELGDAWTEPFHMITHSTGALVVRHWIATHYSDQFASQQALQNVVFLAGPHFGSRLAHHGRSMLAHAAYWGDTGNQVLTALELGSEFLWEMNDAWLDEDVWKGKGIRPFCLIGDRVENNYFKSKILPAAYEKGSDMVVRAAAGNMNFRRFSYDTGSDTLNMMGEIKGVPYAALASYVHSGAKNGIMNSIKKGTNPSNSQSLGLIVDCLAVHDQNSYDAMEDSLQKVTQKTRQKRTPYAQIDFRFSDDTGAPIEDYCFSLGVLDKGREKASDAVAHIHRNKKAGNHMSVFINYGKLRLDTTYFIEIKSSSDTSLFGYQPEDLRLELTGDRLQELVSPDQTTQIDIVLQRQVHPNLFRFHPGDDPQLHVRWDRKGEITKKRLKTR